MLATVASSTLLGVEGAPVAVEVQVAHGLPSFTIVGLPDASCRESRDRVRAAIVSSGMRWPPQRITVNLAPTHQRKGGAALDLAIAIAVLAADGQLEPGQTRDRGFLGELGLDGTIRRVPGIVSLVDAIGSGEVVVPAGCVAEARLIGGRRVLPALHLRSLVAALRGEEGWPDLPVAPAAPAAAPIDDLADVHGQVLGRTALEVAAAGGHHLLLVGPPGAGKTMLARRLPGILPPLEPGDALEVARVHSAAGLDLPAGGLVVRPPFRAPHHGASPVSLVGGGTARLRPGEISCAHCGVLFLDELGEFSLDVIEALRQPLEEGRVLVCRARAAVTFPARFILVAATNPCPCGDSRPGFCRCRESARARYRSRLSGPLLDRFDLRVGVERPEPSELLGTVHNSPAGECSATVAVRVAAARRLAAGRGVRCNAQIPASALDRWAPLAPDAAGLLEQHLRQGRLSARGLHRIRRVALTLSDLAGRSGPLRAEEVHAALALRADPFAAMEDP